ncbi:hypothetical protein BCR44DRAFT_1439126 [Catenaria anguillulae PL171]|uniref:Uncharacterized protein n=1 Tax=Catenaria anguillulae PL171 TaxID=765915 RepID=A0A1Y2HIL6_9FUNG|nr:hypothetical protein BCR44DRAFT_1439126 [Catenaria anguillulae PL171]
MTKCDRFCTSSVTAWSTLYTSASSGSAPSRPSEYSAERGTLGTAWTPTLAPSTFSSTVHTSFSACRAPDADAANWLKSGTISSSSVMDSTPAYKCGVRGNLAMSASTRVSWCTSARACAGDWTLIHAPYRLHSASSSSCSLSSRTSWRARRRAPTGVAYFGTRISRANPAMTLAALR